MFLFSISVFSVPFYAKLLLLSRMTKKVKIVCISDTHNCNEQIKVPDGDILIHAGDATVQGTQLEVEEFLLWFSSLPHEHKIFVAGNHDWLFETNNRFARNLIADSGTIYLQDSATEIEGMKIYGRRGSRDFSIGRLT